MTEFEIGNFSPALSPQRQRAVNRAISVTFGITAVNEAGTRQKIPGTGVFIAPYLALTAKHVLIDVTKLHDGVPAANELLPISVKLHQIMTLDQQKFAVTPFASWDVKEFTLCPYTDLVLLDVVPSNSQAEALAASQWNGAMFRMHLLPPEPNSRARIFGFPAIDWTFDQAERRMNITSGIVMSEGRITEVFPDWRVEPQPASPPILSPTPAQSGDQTLTDFPCFEMTDPIESGMSGAPVFYGDELFGILSTGFDLEEGDSEDATRSRAASLWPLIFTRNIPTGLDRVSFLDLLRSALINCPDWRDAERMARLEDVHGRTRARMS